MSDEEYNKLTKKQEKEIFDVLHYDTDDLSKKE